MNETLKQKAQRLYLRCQNLLNEWEEWKKKAIEDKLPSHKIDATNAAFLKEYGVAFKEYEQANTEAYAQ